MGGFNDAPRCPASLTFRDSPALLRQESDGYPVRPVASTPTPRTEKARLCGPKASQRAPPQKGRATRFETVLLGEREIFGETHRSLALWDSRGPTLSQPCY